MTHLPENRAEHSGGLWHLAIFRHQILMMVTVSQPLEKSG
jgi:hypothetical protein